MQPSQSGNGRKRKPTIALIETAGQQIVLIIQDHIHKNPILEPETGAR